MSLPVYAGPLERTWYYSFRFLCGLIFLFLIAPIIIIIPLSFNAEPYFSFSEGMVRLDPDAYSLRWYKEFFGSQAWVNSFKNSFIIATFATIFATVLGTVAALGLSRREMPYRNLIMSILISPMIAPIIISAVGMYFFYSRYNLQQSYLGVILAHTAMGIPFVVITVTATMSGFDRNLIRAAQSLGADSVRTFFKVIMPLIAPGVISGALFAFITSFDEVVIVLFLAGAEQRTVTMQMWAGIRENISPTILAVATLLIIISVSLLATLELLRRRNERLRGIRPT
jgi:putative spermidine/putrescine transport system permease protein